MKGIDSMKYDSPNLRGLLLCISACYIAIGAVLLAFPGISLITVCEGIGIGAIILGIVAVAFYFIRQGFRSENNVSFAAGMAAVILGLYAVLRTQEFSRAFTQVLAFCVIADGILKLQFSMDLLRLKGKLWWLLLLLSLAVSGAAMALLLYPFPSVEEKNFYTYIVLIIDGVLNAASVLWLSRRRGSFMKAEAALESGEDKSGSKPVSDVKPEPAKKHRKWWKKSAEENAAEQEEDNTDFSDENFFGSVPTPKPEAKSDSSEEKK